MLIGVKQHNKWNVAADISNDDFIVIYIPMCELLWKNEKTYLSMEHVIVYLVTYGLLNVHDHQYWTENTEN